MEHVKPQTRQTKMVEKQRASSPGSTGLCTTFISIKNNSKRLISVPGGLLNDSVIKEKQTNKKKAVVSV